MIERHPGPEVDRCLVLDPERPESGPVSVLLLELPAPSMGPSTRSLRVTILGELTAATATELHGELEPMADLANPLIIDLSGLSRLDDAGTTVLVALYEQLRTHGATLLIDPPDNHLAEALAVTEIGHVLVREGARPA